jgi:isopenicillin N synthase-like dioxygenase
MLHGRGCGGLQVLPPGSSKWQHIRPLPGHAVCNVGDTLAVYSGNIFKSNVSRQQREDCYPQAADLL